MPCGPPTSRCPSAPASWPLPCWSLWGFTSILLGGTWVLLCGPGPPRRVWPWGGLSPCPGPWGPSKGQPRSDPEGLHWASPGLGRARRAAERSPRCSGPRVSELSLRATLEATGLWEAHVLALPPSQSPEAGVAGQPCLRDRRAPHAGQSTRPGRFSLPSRPVSVLPGRARSLRFW